MRKEIIIETVFKNNYEVFEEIRRDIDPDDSLDTEDFNYQFIEALERDFPVLSAGLL